MLFDFGFGFCSQGLQFGFEFQLFVQRTQSFDIRGFEFEGIQSGVYRDVGVDGNHLSAVASGRGVFDEILTPFLLLHFIHTR